MNGGPPNAWRGASTPTPVVTTARDTGAGSGKYRRGRDEYEVLLYLEGLRNEFRALKAAHVHVEEVAQQEPSPSVERPIEASIESIQADFDVLEGMEELRHETAARLTILERLVAKLEALEARIREEEEILLLH